mgnify:CR=1 FL=1
MTNYYGNRWMLIRCSRVLEPLDKCSDAKNSQAASSGLLTGAGAYLLVEIRLVLQRLGLWGCSGI